MNIRFWKRFHLKKRFYLNLSKSGLSLSYRGKWVNITFGKNGVRFSKAIKNTGIYFTDYKHY